ncbi:hypothetical protein D3C71_1594660 [compost metagenome]
MLVGVQPQVVLQVLRQIAPAQLVQVFEQRFAAPDQHRQQAQPQQLAEGIGHAQRRQERRVAVDHHVHRHADQHLGQDVEELVDNGKTAGQVHVAAISPRVLEQSGQG